MPLEEISGNVPRSTSASYSSKSRHDSSSTTPGPPRAVQSMLRTTTELGDLGQFGSGHSRLTRSGSRVQTVRVRSGSYDTSLASALRHDRSTYARHSNRHYGPRPTASTSTLSGRHTSRSNLSSHAPSIHSRVQRQRRHHLVPTNSPHPEIYTHRSLVTLRTEDVHTHKSVLPHGSLHRMGSLPFRASSPAYTDSRSLHTPQPGLFRAPSTGTVASSPVSAYRRVPSTGPYQRDLNASYGSLHPPSACYDRRSGLLPPFAPPARIYTPRLGGTSAPTGEPDNTTSLAGLPRSPSGSTAPAYYDYTESFTEETCFSPDSLEAAEQPPLTINETIWEGVPTIPARHAQTPFGTREGSKFHPSELPTKHNRRLSEQSKRSWKTKTRPVPDTILCQDAKRSYADEIPQRLSSIGAANAHDTHVIEGVRARSRSRDSGAGDLQLWDPRRTCNVSRKSLTASPSSTFFAGASRSTRDLAMLAARVHSPVPDNSLTQSMLLKKVEKKHREIHLTSQSPLPCSNEISAKRTPDWQIPSLTFRPMSFMSNTSVISIRPRTSEAASSRCPIGILSPFPKRPASSQSRKRFSKILDIETIARRPLEPTIVKQSSLIKASGLVAVEENPAKSLLPAKAVVGSITADGPSVSSAESDGDAIEEKAIRVSGVTSHDKSTVESLLDKHIECLGLQPDVQDVECAGEFSDNREISASDSQTNTDTSTTVQFTDILGNVPIMEGGRPTTSASQQYSSLATIDRQALKPRRLFASMDGRVPGVIEGRSLATGSASRHTENSRPSFGWQTLPSNSLLDDSARYLPSWTSGELGDVDTTETTRLRVKKRSLLSGSPSEGSFLSTLSSDLLGSSKTCGLHKRSKSDVTTRQASHRRRRIRIRLRMSARSKTTSDLLNLGNDVTSAPQNQGSNQADEPTPKDTGVALPSKGFAELSGDSVPASRSNLESKPSRPPPIPTRWSSIIAAMPQPGKKSHEATRKPSVRSHRSQRSKTSVVEPVNTTRIHKPISQLNSIPRLDPPDLGPPLTSSELNLSIPYADIPSTIRPTLRETKSFFSDDSSAQRQRGSLRQKLHLHSLRNAIPASGLTSTTPSRHSNGVTLSHSCQMKGRLSAEEAAAYSGNTIPMTDLAYRRRKVMGKLKEWWNRQCLQRVVRGRKRKQRAIPGAELL